LIQANSTEGLIHHNKMVKLLKDHLKEKEMLKKRNINLKKIKASLVKCFVVELNIMQLENNQSIKRRNKRR